MHCHLHAHTIILLMTFPLWIPFENEWWTFFALMALIIGCIFGSEIALRKSYLSAEYNRRLIHFIVGIMITTSPMVFDSYLPPSFLAFIFIVINYLAFNNQKFKGIHSQSRVTFGTIYFPIAYLLIVLGFWDYPELIIISLSLLAFCDPFAAHIGESTKSPTKFKIWEDYKSIQGTVAFFISALVLIYSFSQYFFSYPISLIFLFSLFTATGATIAEITSNRGSDNLSIPIVSMLFMVGFINNLSESNNNIVDILFSMTSLMVLLIFCLFTFSYWLKSLNKSGFCGALIMAIVILLLGSLIHLISLAIFFILSSIISKVFKSKSFYRSKGSRRDIIQVYANGGVATFICIIDFLYPNPYNIYLFLASVAGAMSDTWGTEFGKLSKIKPISIISFRPISHGISGGITRVGTLGSLLGSCIIGFTAWYLMPIGGIIIYCIILSGFLGAIIDSIFGATYQARYETQNGDIVEKYREGSILISGKSWINNDIVNLINTMAAPILMYFFLLIIR